MWFVIGKLLSDCVGSPISIVLTTPTHITRKGKGGRRRQRGPSKTTKVTDIGEDASYWDAPTTMTIVVRESHLKCLS